MSGTRVRRRNVWTREEVLAALREWVERYGEVPAATDFHPGDCMRSARISAARSAAWVARAERSNEGVWPWPRTVQRLFGSWAAAVKEAGYQPRREAMPKLAPTVEPRAALARIRGLAAAELVSDAEARVTLTAIATEALRALEAE